MVLFEARPICVSREVGKIPLRPNSINATQRRTAMVVAKVPEQKGPTPSSPAHGYASPNPPPPPIREPKPIRLLAEKAAGPR